MEREMPYTFNRTTGVFIKEVDPVISPLDGAEIIPATATKEKPPEASAFESAVWDGSSWQLMPNYKDAVIYDKRTGEQTERNFKVGEVPDFSRYSIEKPEVDATAGMSEEEKAEQEEAKIWAVFESEASAPATTIEPEGTWKGGEASALAIRGAALLAEDNGLTTAVITDVNREEHELTIEEIKKVSTAILLQWQAAFFKRQAALREIES